MRYSFAIKSTPSIKWYTVLSNKWGIVHFYVNFLSGYHRLLNQAALVRLRPLCEPGHQASQFGSVNKSLHNRPWVPLVSAVTAANSSRSS